LSPSLAVIPRPAEPSTFRELLQLMEGERNVNRPIVWFLLGVVAYYVYIHMVQKVPTDAAKPGAGGR